MKTAFKKLTALVLALCTAFCLTSCGNDKNENQKYDVSIKIVSDDGGEWIFTPDVDEMSITRAYDGKKHKFKVAGWQLPDSPDEICRENWIKANTYGSDAFHCDFLYTAPNGTQNVQDYLCERGYYVFTCETHNPVSWNFRAIYLHIFIE